MDLLSHQLGCGRAADLHRINDGAVGEQLCPGGNTVFLVGAMLAHTDTFQEAGLIRPDLPDVETLALTEMLVDDFTG